MGEFQGLCSHKSCNRWNLYHLHKICSAFFCNHHNTMGFLPLINNSMQKAYSFYGGWNKWVAEIDWGQEIHQKCRAALNCLRLWTIFLTLSSIYFMNIFGDCPFGGVKQDKTIHSGTIPARKESNNPTIQCT